MKKLTWNVQVTVYTAEGIILLKNEAYRFINIINKSENYIISSSSHYRNKDI